LGDIDFDAAASQASFAILPRHLADPKVTPNPGGIDAA